MHKKFKKDNAKHHKMLLVKQWGVGWCSSTCELDAEELYKHHDRKLFQENLW